MKQSTAFEAWKNFILILAGVLAGEMLSSFGKEGSFIDNVTRGIEYFISFDKQLGHHLHAASTVLTVLIVLYFLKAAHSIIVSIFDDDYYSRVSGSAARAMALCALATAVVISLTFVPYLAIIVRGQSSVAHAGIVLASMVAIPPYLFLMYSFALVNDFDFRTIFKRILPSNKSFDEVGRSWICLNILSLGLLGSWCVVMVLHAISDAQKIEITIVTLMVFLILNSIFDYVINRSFFFGFARLTSPPSPLPSRRRERAAQGKTSAVP